ncbi:uncharacterized protein ISCGN_018966 [Ixodes scapularis]
MQSRILSREEPGRVNNGSKVALDKLHPYRLREPDSPLPVVKKFRQGDSVFAQSFVTGPFWNAAKAIAVKGPVSYLVRMASGEVLHKTSQSAEMLVGTEGVIRRCFRLPRQASSGIRLPGRRAQTTHSGSTTRTSKYQSDGRLNTRSTPTTKIDADSTTSRSLRC